MSRALTRFLVVAVGSSLLFGVIDVPLRGQASVSTGQMMLVATRVTDDVLVSILNDGRLRELNSISGASVVAQDLQLRLFEVPVEGVCATIETEVICSHRYYLAVRTFELGLPEAVFALGEVGAINEIEWLPTNHEYPAARLRMRVTNYPEYDFLREDLTLREQIQILDVTLDSINVTQVAP